jgi:mannitol-specific phosphotransferase system IIBC component
MSFSPIRKIWITLISILAMLMSSFVYSAPLMTFQMASNTHQTNMQADTPCGMTAKVDHSHHEPTHVESQSQNACSGENDIAHNCCGSVCASAVALFTPSAQSAHIASFLALIHSESVGDTVYRQASLYRPPIA